MDPMSTESVGDDFDIVGAYNNAPPYEIRPQTDSQQSDSTPDQNGTVQLNPRSCVTCRRRKVRCDKREPCSNCTKAGGDCVFPAPGRAPRKPRRPQDAELLRRLRKLENVVDSLGASVDDDAIGPLASTGGASTVAQQKQSPFSDLGADAWQKSIDKSSALEQKLGRLVIKEGRSRYVSNDFWSSLDAEISDMRDILDGASTEEEEDAASPDNSTMESHQAFVLGYSSLMLNMTKFHPSPSQIFILWEIYKESVDPVVKLVHCPSVKNIIMKAAVSIDSLDRPCEVLFYAICLGAVISMTEDQCQSLLDDTKDKLVKRYRFATEQGLARAGFLNSASLMVLQAFILYLMVIRFVDSSKSMWSLAGLSVYQAQALGLHRDGTNFNLDPFEIEMRRRIWWHISLLDARASEDFGTDPTFNERYFDTRFPLNINDDDIWPGMKDAPQERKGATDMTFSLVRFELGTTSRKLRLATDVSRPSGLRERTWQEKEKLIDSCHQWVEDKYLQHCDTSVPIYWVAATIGRLILAKMWLMVHHPRLHHPDSDTPTDLRDRIFNTSVEVIEFGHVLSSNKETAKWTWLFLTYMQWHAVAYVLSELCQRSPGPDVDRAWHAVESVYDKRLTEQARSQRGMLWRPLKQLMARAKAHRNKTASNPTSPQSHRTASTSSTASGVDSWPPNYAFSPVLPIDNDMSGLDLVGMVPMNTTNNMPMVTQAAAPNDDQLPDSFAWSGWSPGLGDYNGLDQQMLGSMPLEWF